MNRVYCRAARCLQAGGNIGRALAGPGHRVTGTVTPLWVGGAACFKQPPATLVSGAGGPARGRSLHTGPPRHSDAGSGSGSGEGATETDIATLYDGPLKNVVRLLKTVSVTTSLMSASIVPMALAFASDSMPVVAKVAMGGSICIFAFGTTAVMHLATHTYVRTITCSAPDGQRINTAAALQAELEAEADEADADAAGDTADDGYDEDDEDDEDDLNDPRYNVSDVQITLETLTFFARPTYATYPLANLVEPGNPLGFATFEAEGRSFFVHNELILQDPKLKLLFPFSADPTEAQMEVHAKARANYQNPPDAINDSEKGAKDK